VEACIDGAIVLLSALFSATFGRASEAGQLKKAILVFVIVTAIGIVGGGIYFSLRSKGYGVEWREITCFTPKMGEARIIGLDSDSISLKFGNTKRGVRIWENRVFPFLNAPICFDGTPDDANARITQDCQSIFWMPSSPGPIKEQAATLSNGSTVVCMEVAILSDESIWYWRSEQYGIGYLVLFALMYGGFPGCIAGFVMVWLMCKLYQKN
jgi:hypothetical protein